MDTPNRVNRWGLVACLLGTVLVAGGCARTVTITDRQGNTVEMPKDLYAQQQQQEANTAMMEQFSDAFAPTNAELSEMGEVADTFRKAMALALMPQIAQAMQQDGYWDYKAAKLQFWGNVIAGPASALLQPFANRLAYGKTGAAYGGSGYTELNFGNRTAKGGGKGGEGDTTASTSASGDTSFEEVYVSTGNRSPQAVGDGVFLQAPEVQYQTGDGTQGQLFTRPFNQPNISFDEGGDVNNTSEGASGEAGFGLP